MEKITSILEKQLKEAPAEKFDLIVRTTEAPPSHLKWLASEGIEVRRKFRLTPGLAVSCRGRDALRLLDAAWIVSIELDGPVQAR
jgi:hypothetical protein